MTWLKRSKKGKSENHCKMKTSMFDMSPVAEKTFLWVSDLVRHKLACTAIEHSWRLEVSDVITRQILQSRQRSSHDSAHYTRLYDIVLISLLSCASSLYALAGPSIGE